MINKIDYFKYCLNSTELLKLDWYYSFLVSLTSKEINTNYLRNTNSKLEVKINNEWEECDESFSLPVYTLQESINLNSGDLKNLNENITTTIGRAIANKVLLEYPLGNKISYINKKFSIPDIEDILASMLQKKTCSIAEYLKFTNSCSFLSNLSIITNVSATYKNVLPPPNLEKFKKEKSLEYDAKYGKNWRKDRLRCVEFQDELKKLDDEWLKDDPSYGKLLNKKIKDNARVKMFLSFGPEVGFDKSGEKMEFVENSLMDQYPDDTKQITAMFNSARSGSFDRGSETQKGGQAAKDILRATSSYNIKEGNCGSKLGKLITVTKDNAQALKGRYMIVSGKPILIEQPDSLIGKTITIRSPMYCKVEGSTFCTTCCGSTMTTHKNGLSLSVLNISNILLNTSLKSMHNSQVALTDLNLNDVMS